MKTLNNTSILNGLLHHDRPTVKYVYKQYFPMVREMVLRSPRSSIADAEDVFMNALEVVYLKIRKGILQLNCQFATYLYAICYRQWCKELRRRNQQLDVELFMKKNYPEIGNDIQYDIEEGEKLNLYRQKFNELTKGSQDILRLSFLGLSGDEIANKLGLSSAAYVYKKCSHCRKKLMHLIRKDVRYFELKESVFKTLPADKYAPYQA